MAVGVLTLTLGRHMFGGYRMRMLIGGGAMFGAGWGLAGFCPGPALAALSFGGGSLILFVAAMLAGIDAFRLTLGAKAAA